MFSDIHLISAKKDILWKYQALTETILNTCHEKECNDTYGQLSIYQTL